MRGCAYRKKGAGKDKAAQYGGRLYPLALLQNSLPRRDTLSEREREREIEPRERFTSFRSLELPSSRRKLYST